MTETTSIPITQPSHTATHLRNPPPRTIRQRVKSFFARLIVDLILLVCRVTCALFRRANKPTAGDPRVLLLTGTFYNSGWFRAHFTPLSRAERLDKIIVVGDEPLDQFQKFVYDCPPKWLQRLASRPLARLIWTWHATGKHRAGTLMGYHIMPNALICLFVAALRRRRAIYQMTGGPTQIIGGGYLSENSILRRLGAPSTQRLRAFESVIRSFDATIVRGDLAREFVNENKLSERCAIITGGGDVQAFLDAPSLATREFDLISVGRLVPVKRMDRAIRILASLQAERPGTNLLIVGDGPLRSELEALADQLGVTDHVCFFGQTDDVSKQLNRARAFILTSETEGLAIAMVEAMAAGLPAIAPPIGDLGYLLHENETGIFIDAEQPDRCARQISELLSDAERVATLGRAAQTIAFERCDYSSLANTWDAIFADMHNGTKAKKQRRPRAFSRKNLWDRAPGWVKKTAGLGLGWMPQQRLLGKKFSENYTRAREADRWTTTQIRDQQLAALRDICMHAKENSPYCRRIFAEYGFDPARLQTAEDLQVLPRIDKATLSEHLDEMKTKSLADPGVDEVATGGSGGEPLRFYIGSDRSAIEFAHLVTQWERGGFTLGMPTAVFRGEEVTNRTRGVRTKYDPILRRHFFSNFHMSDDDMRSYLEFVARLPECALLTYPSSAYALARFIHQGGHEPLTNVRAILVGSEMTYAGQRELAESAFNSRYYTWYGHSEKLVLAGECEHSTDYHVAPSYGYCELLDDDGNPVTAPGEQGEIVGTGFINRVVPFIRYRTGDYATLVGNKCAACGRETMILRDIKGHLTQEQLYVADGSAVSWTSLNMHDDTFDNVRQFQFSQHTPGRCTLKIVPEPEFGDNDAARILRNLDRKLDGRMDVTIDRVEEIPLTRNGKTIYVDQKIKADHTAPREGIAT